eukprot:1160936-Pelagomonas_calceolata.AAC.24
MSCRNQDPVPGASDVPGSPPAPAAPLPELGPPAAAPPGAGEFPGTVRLGLGPRSWEGTFEMPGPGGTMARARGGLDSSRGAGVLLFEYFQETMVWRPGAVQWRA